MTYTVKDVWQHLLSQQEKQQLLKKLFLDVLFHLTNLPEFMTDRDWSDLVQEIKLDHSFHPANRQYSVFLNVEEFAYKHWVPGSDNYFIIYDFLKNHLANVKLGPVNLFDSCIEQNMRLWFDFNLEAVYLCIAREMDSIFKNFEQ